MFSFIISMEHGTGSVLPLYFYHLYCLCYLKVFVGLIPKSNDIHVKKN